jgi:hypothetical protein
MNDWLSLVDEIPQPLLFDGVNLRIYLAQLADNVVLIAFKLFIGKSTTMFVEVEGDTNLCTVRFKNGFSSPER